MPLAFKFGLSEGRLRTAIESDRERGIPSSRANKIDRSHYAKILSCTPSALTRFRNVFDEYEVELGIRTKLERLYAELRKWLTVSYDKGELLYQNRKINRLACCKHFNISPNELSSRYPGAYAIFQEFDARAIREEYISASMREELCRVALVLGGQPSLKTDHLRIDRKALSQAAQVPKSRFRIKQFAALVEAKELKILQAALIDNTNPYIYGRVFPFSELVSNWGAEFPKKLGANFKKGISSLGKKTVKGMHSNLLLALVWVGLSKNPDCQKVVAEARKFGKIREVDSWDETLNSYRHYLITTVSAKKAKTSVDAQITFIRMALSAVASSGVFPLVATPIRGLKLAPLQDLHLRSIAEAEVRGGSGSAAHLSEFAKAQLSDACKQAEIQISEGESDRFLQGLLSTPRASGSLPAEPATIIRLLLEARLDLIRQSALEIIERGRRMFEDGQVLLAEADIDGELFAQQYLRMEKSFETQLIRKSYFPSIEGSDEQSRRGLANLLGLIDQCYFGIPPTSLDKDHGFTTQFFAKRYAEHGGLRAVADMMNPSPDVAGALLTLYLLESGANVSVGRTLLEDCIELIEDGTSSRIVGSKNRAGGKSIIVDHPTDSVLVQTIRWYQAASARLRARAGEDGQYLLLMRIGARIQPVSEHWYAPWFQRFVGSIPALSMLSITPNMLRPSLLLHTALANDGRLATGIALGKHRPAVSQGYQIKYPTRVLYDDNIKGFQSLFETLVLSGIEEAAAKLGVSSAEFESRLAQLRLTGLGTFCQNVGGPDIRPGSKCANVGCWNDCPHMLLVAEVKAIAALLLWQQSLRAAQADWERDQPERWEQVWLPWLCFADVVEQKMSRGPLIRVLVDARQHASQLSSQPGFVAAQPW